MNRQILKVILCDDHYISLVGLELILRKISQKPLEIRMALSGEEALRQFETDMPDLILIDLKLPGISGLDLIKTIRSKSSSCRILVMTGIDDAHILRQTLQYNINGLLRKLHTSHNLQEAFDKLWTSDQSSTYLDPSVEKILESSHDKALTRREYEVLELMLQGMTSHEISQKLNCSVTTIKTYRTRIMNKSGARNAAEIMAWFLNGNMKRNCRPDT